MRLLLLMGLLLPGVCLLAAPARAEFYQWVDPQGQVHMTDDLSQVPPAHRAAARRAAKATGRDSAPRWNSIDSKPQPASVPAEPESSDEARVHVIPVERAGTRLTVLALLNGATRAWFKVDTGAEVNMIPRSVVDALGIQIDESTPTMAVVGISGQPMRLPIITLEEIRLGEASVKKVDMVVNDRRSQGLLGMTFFNHFKVHTDPAGGKLMLEEVDLDGVDGVYGGFGESYWRREFRSLHSQLEQIERQRQLVPSTHVTWRDRLDHQESRLRNRLGDLHERASRGGVPQAWRE
jgi:predicted aspartyl protease